MFTIDDTALYDRPSYNMDKLLGDGPDWPALTRRAEIVLNDNGFRNMFELIPGGASTPASPTHKGTVYLSGPITGQSYNMARYGWRKYVSDRLAPGITVLSPMRHEGHLKEIGIINEANLPDHFFTKSKIIVQKDKLDIQRSDIILANFLGAKTVSKGTLVEIGMAYAMDKTIIACLEPRGNPNDSFFVHEPSLVLASLDQAIEAINSLLSEGV